MSVSSTSENSKIYSLQQEHNAETTGSKPVSTEDGAETTNSDVPLTRNAGIFSQTSAQQEPSSTTPRSSMAPTLLWRISANLKKAVALLAKRSREEGQSARQVSLHAPENSAGAAAPRSKRSVADSQAPVLGAINGKTLLLANRPEGHKQAEAQPTGERPAGERASGSKSVSKREASTAFTYQETLSEKDVEAMFKLTVSDMIKRFYPEETSDEAVQKLRKYDVFKHAVDAWGGGSFSYAEFRAKAANNQELIAWASKASGIDASKLDADHILVLLKKFVEDIRERIAPSTPLPTSLSSEAFAEFRKEFLDEIINSAGGGFEYVYYMPMGIFMADVLLASCEQQASTVDVMFKPEDGEVYELGLEKIRPEDAGEIKGGSGEDGLNGRKAGKFDRLTINDIFKNYYSGSSSNDQLARDFVDKNPAAMPSYIFDILEDISGGTDDVDPDKMQGARVKDLVAKATGLPASSLGHDDVKAFCFKLASYVRAQYAPDLTPPFFFKTDGSAYRDALASRIQAKDTTPATPAKFVANCLVEYIKEKQGAARAAKHADETGLKNSLFFGPSRQRVPQKSPGEDPQFELHLDLHSSDFKFTKARPIRQGDSVDYDYIKKAVSEPLQELKAKYRSAISQIARSKSEAQGMEQALLAELKRSGIAIKAKIYDEDKSVDIYDESFTVSSNASTIDGYFDEIAEGFYQKARKDIEVDQNEGRISITRVDTDISAPRLISAENGADIDSKYIYAFNIRDADNSYELADAHTSRGAKLIGRFFYDFSNELREVNGEASESKTLQKAVDALLAADGKDYRAASASERGDAEQKLMGIYYRFYAKSLGIQQRLMVYGRPYPTNYMVQQMGDYLGIKPSEYYKLLDNGLADHTYYKRRINTISSDGVTDGITYDSFQYNGSFYELFFDGNEKFNLDTSTNATVRNQLFESFKSQFKIEPGKEAGLRERFEKLFLTPDGSGARNESVPAALRSENSNNEYKAYYEKYVESSSKIFRDLEIQRIVSLRPDAAKLFAENGSDNEKLFAHLSQQEKDELDQRVANFERLLKRRMSPEIPRHPYEFRSHLWNAFREMASNIPVIGDIINLPYDMVEGNWENVGHEVLRLVATTVSLIPAVGPVMGATMFAADAAWTVADGISRMVGAAQRGDKAGMSAALVEIEGGAIGLTMSGASAVHGFGKARAAGAAAESGRSSGAIPDESTSTPEVPEGENVPTSRTREGEGAGAATESQSNGPGGPRQSGGASENVPGKENDKGASQGALNVTGISDLGDAEIGSRRATVLQGSRDNIYMFNGRAYVLSEAGGSQDLMPLAKLSLEERGWARVGSSSQESIPALRLGKPGVESPQGFKGGFDPDPSFGAVTVKAGEMPITSQDTAHPAAENKALHLAVVDDKYVAFRNGKYEPLFFNKSDESGTMFHTVDGQTLKVGKKLSAMPEYKQEITAKITGKSGMFATVELNEIVDGVGDTRTVSGVVAPLKDGSGTELVIKAADGVYYRAKAPVSGNDISGVTEVSMQRISPYANPKRAWPGAFRNNEAYARSSIAHDDYALELYLGSEYGNEAYTVNAKWVEESTTKVRNVPAGALSPDVMDKSNPYYTLPTTQEDAILFAPRNRAKLAGTIIGESSVFEATSRPQDVAFAKQSIGATTIDGNAISWSDEGRAAIKGELKLKLQGDDLAFMRVTKQDGSVAIYYAHLGSHRVQVGSGIEHVVPNTSDPQLISSTRFAKKTTSAAGTLIDHLQRSHKPGDVRSVELFTVDRPDGLTATRIFDTSKDGYRYSAVTYLDEDPKSGSWGGKAQGENLKPVRAHESLPGYERWRDFSVPIYLDGMKLVMPEGFYEEGSANYVKLDRDGKVYQVRYDPAYDSWKIVNPNDPYAEGAAAAYVKRVGGKWEVLEPKLGLRGGGKWVAKEQNGVEFSVYEPEFKDGVDADHYGPMSNKDAKNTTALKAPSEKVVLVDTKNGAPAVAKAKEMKIYLSDQIFSKKGAERPELEPGPSKRAKSALEIYGTSSSVPESCIGSTEGAISRMAGGTGEPVRARNGNYSYTVPNVEIVDAQGKTLNISHDTLDSKVRTAYIETGPGQSRAISLKWVGRSVGRGVGRAENYFGEGGRPSLPKVGEGVAFIKNNRAGKGGYDFHFLACVGEITDANGKTVAVLMTDLSEVEGQPNQVSNYNLKVYNSVDEMRGHDYPNDQFYSVLARPYAPGPSGPSLAGRLNPKRPGRRPRDQSSSASG